MLTDALQERISALPLPYLALAIAIIVIPVLVLTSNKRDPREPPEIKAKIPVLGHVINMLGNGMSYFTKLSAENPDLAVFTVNIPGARNYVITTPSLMSAIQRNSRNISFDYFLDVATDRMCGCNKTTQHISREKRFGGLGVSHKMVESMLPTLLGEGLDGMNETMVKGLKIWMDDLATGRSPTIELHDWVREVMTVASADSAWGSKNPYRSKFIRDSFWDFENGMGTLMVKILPQITARKAYQGREVLVKAFKKFIKSGGMSDASMLAKTRYKVYMDNNVTEDEYARIEASFGLGLLSNTVPTTYWFLFDIFSRPELLEQLRQEIRENALHIKGDSATIDVADIRDKCPMLLSAFQESMRYRSRGAPTRYVYEDTLLEDKYLLKAGSIVYMPIHPIHSHPDVWSNSTAEFIPTRYLKSNARKIGGFLPFGVSPSICPGRHFATGEILSFASTFMLRFDMSPAKTSTWIAPKLDLQSIVSTNTPPGEPLHVNIKLREEYKGLDWDFRVTKGKGQFALVIG